MVQLQKKKKEKKKKKKSICQLIPEKGGNSTNQVTIARTGRRQRQGAQQLGNTFTEDNQQK